MVPVRVVAAATATPIIAAAAEPKPVVWEFLGLHFEAGPLVTGLCGVALVRAIIFLQKGGGRKGVALDIMVYLMCSFVTALWVQDNHLKAFIAGLYGMGIGVVGIGLLTVAKGLSLDKRLSAAFTAFTGGATPPEPLPPPREPTREQRNVPDDMNDLVNRAGAAIDDAEARARQARLNPGGNRAPPMPSQEEHRD